MTTGIESRIQQAEATLQPYWQELETRCQANLERVLQGFLENKLSEQHFASVTGYGHNDMGRAATDDIFAHALHAEAALVRLQFVSGTHAIGTALKGCLQPGDTLVTLTGRPYDTLEEVIGIRDASRASLTSQGVKYEELDFLNTASLRLDWTAEEKHVIEKAQVAFIQRSRGYSTRPSLTVTDIEALIGKAKGLNPELIVVVDNCYGEFIETLEPTSVGADLIAGSLIKNPGGGIVPAGGYIAGKAEWVQAAADELTAPGIGAKGGYTFELTRTILQGLYFAPTVVKEAMKGMSLVRQVFHDMGYEVMPRVDDPQADIIQLIQLGTAEKVLGFCRALQSVSPVDAYLTPEPAVTPGYADAVVMAGGTFIFGSTIELSADAPMREPYSVFLQGGLTYSHVRYALKRILEQLACATETEHQGSPV